MAFQKTLVFLCLILVLGCHKSTTIPVVSKPDTAATHDTVVNVDTTTHKLVMATVDAVKYNSKGKRYIGASTTVAWSDSIDNVLWFPYHDRFKKQCDTKKYNVFDLGAQAKQESGFDSTAVSYVGAAGILQFMPKTAKDFGIDPVNIDQAIDGAIRYDQKSYQTFADVPNDGYRFQVVMSAYNAGAGNTMKAMVLIRKTLKLPECFESYKIAMPLVTGKHADETIGYCETILKQREIYNQRYKDSKKMANDTLH